jgi:hypothetical protein
MTISEFIEEYEAMSGGSEQIDDPEVLFELHALVSDMFNTNCNGVVPEFELINGGKTIKLLTKDL